MSTLSADPGLVAYLTPLKERTEICDNQGKLVGIFIPASEAHAPDYQKVRKLFDPEEIQRRKERSRNEPGVPLSQIMKRLQKGVS